MRKGNTAYSVGEQCASSTRHVPIEETPVYTAYVDLSHQVWNVVKQWPTFERDTIGKQLVRAADSVGANLVEGDGRHGAGEALQFFRIARASARETRYWIRLATDRELIPVPDGEAMVAALTDATRQLNGLIRYRTAHKHNSSVRESLTPYVIAEEDPFAAEDIMDLDASSQANSSLNT